MRVWTAVANWLDRRFPEKVVVTANAYMSLHGEISMIRQMVENHELSLNKSLERLSVVESNAVHKGAVSDLVIAVKTLKEDYATFKANTLGGGKPITDAEINALFNGGPING